jgi:hypothetical protein
MAAIPTHDAVVVSLTQTMAGDCRWALPATKARRSRDRAAPHLTQIGWFTLAS